MEGESESTGEDTEEHLVSKKKNNGSLIWRWFGFKTTDEQQKDVICRECRKQVPTKSSSTTNLFHHLKQRHKKEYEECVKLRAAAQTVNSSQPPAPKQTTLQNAYTCAVPYERKSEKWRMITKAVAHHIAKDMVPLSTVEQHGFIQLLKVLDRRYELPSRNYFAREVLPQMYTEVRERLANQLPKLSHFALTTDMWSSRTCEPYLSVTIHFIEDWELKSACLQTSYFPQDHTGEHIAEALQDVLTNWKLNPAALVAVTTDNGANVVKAVQLNKWQRMQCFGHRLHLAIGHGMDDARVTRAISLCKKVVSSFSYSWKKRRDLAEVQIQLGLPSHQLITETATRWGSRLLMIDRVLEQERALSKVLSADMKTRPLVPTWQDIEVLEAVQKALKPLQDFTDALSGEDYVTLSYVRPVLHLLNKSLLAPAEGESALCKSIKTSIVDYLNNKFADPPTSDLLDTASFVDPRFKAKYIPSEKMDALKHKVISEAESLLRYNDRCSSDLHSSTAHESADLQETAVAAAPAKKKKSLASFFQHNTTTITTFTQREAIESELSSYLFSVCVESDADPLKWWKEHEVVYPALSCLAKKYLCVPATSSPSERIFSCSGNIVSCQRASLKPETVDRLVFLAQNL
ncbi:zinc finger BED domain-containing protein 1 [Austrofundulus limnaeus]|uniref:Zinc finger BED domain-containing protein 1 n=1 Tax=Austrofundulus limnaeus TaxID=52670 RepID=A0A2I4CJA2_AUSLI|nr:PREDICTED: zinc finger BED domain-containing protein 1-like [Austrofundulus limnaeus]